MLTQSQQKKLVEDDDSYLDLIALFDIMNTQFFIILKQLLYMGAFIIVPVKIIFIFFLFSK